MTYRFILIALLLTVPACNRSTTPEKLVQVADQSVAALPEKETSEQIDFGQLLDEIEECNAKDLTYFYQNWEGIHAKLKRAAENKELAGLPASQQEKLWYELSYLSGCRHPDIFKKHGAEMVEILFCFGTDEQLTLLREIYPETDGGHGG